MKKTTIIILIILGCASLYFLFSGGSSLAPDEIKNYRDQAIAEKKADKISVYVKSLDSGDEIAIDANHKYYAASLQKTTLLMTVLKASESDLALLIQPYPFIGAVKEVYKDDVPYPAITDRMVEDKFYTVSDVLKRMIVYSDNDPIAFLAAFVPDVFAKRYEVMYKVGLVGPKDDTRYFTPKNYSKVFEALYENSYLKKETSEAALTLLSQPEYKNALVAGVPSVIRVAHKFGVYGGQVDKSLYDCGIVYSTNPYLICVMTHGTDIKVLEGIIKDISALAYKEINS